MCRPMSFQPGSSPQSLPSSLLSSAKYARLIAEMVTASLATVEHICACEVYTNSFARGFKVLPDGTNSAAHALMPTTAGPALGTNSQACGFMPKLNWLDCRSASNPGGGGTNAAASALKVVVVTAACSSRQASAPRPW